MRDSLRKTIATVETQLEVYRIRADASLAGTYADELDKMQSSLQQCERDVDEIHEEEARMGFGTTDFPELQSVRSTFQPFFALWKTTRELEKKHSRWTKGPVFTLDVDDVAEAIDRISRVFGRL